MANAVVASKVAEHGAQEGYPLDCVGFVEDLDAVSHVEGVLDEEEDAGPKDSVGGASEDENEG